MKRRSSAASHPLREIGRPRGHRRRCATLLGSQAPAPPRHGHWIDSDLGVELARRQPALTPALDSLDPHFRFSRAIERKPLQKSDRVVLARRMIDDRFSGESMRRSCQLRQEPRAWSWRSRRRRGRALGSTNKDRCADCRWAARRARAHRMSTSASMRGGSLVQAAMKRGCGIIRKKFTP